MSHIDQPVQILIRKCHINLKKSFLFKKNIFKKY